ncbi:MAG: 4Fe-4S dicluster domain-containing protein [Alphaproteobacteria bacterium]|nr:MAG: 4Fe-4S dicluster domain-containing protein [Alphaproteobacteria bacterium]
MGAGAAGIGAVAAGKAQGKTTNDAAAKGRTAEGRDTAYHGQAGKRWVMLIDLRKCVGCQACTVACKIENNIPDGRFRTWVPDVEIGTFPNARRAFLPRLCNHCERPSCVEVCPAGATWQRADGVVEIDYDTCWGCGSCVDACPYDARFMNPVTQTADKCTFCSQRIDQGLLPACVETCIGGARQFGDLNDPNDPVARTIRTHPVQVLKPETGNEPRVFYIGLTHELQNNLQGKPTLWSEDREAAGKGDDGTWKIEPLVEMEGADV